MRYTLVIVGTIFAMLLVACGENVLQGNDGVVPGGDETDKGSDSNDINKLEIVGSGDRDAISGATPVIASVNGGEFTLTWGVTSSNPYDIDVFIGTTPTDPLADLFYNGTGECKTASCPNTKTLKCNLIKNQGGDYSLKCALGTMLNISQDTLSNLNFVIVQICNQNTQACATQSVSVSLGD